MTTDNHSTLFSPLTIAAPDGPGLTLRNRTILSPMCQYAVTKHDGVATDWHLQHYGAMAAGGFGMLTIESTGVNPVGRISPNDLGMYSDEQVDAHRRLVSFAHAQGAAVAVQLNHAGGRASGNPWLADSHGGSAPIEDGGWQTVGMTDQSIAKGYRPTTKLDKAGLAEIVQDFADAARQADEAGYDAIQIHAAHGYLLHQSLSPLTNTRTDEYGGSEENRFRLTREVVDAVRAAWPATKPLGIRISATDWVEGGLDIDVTARLMRDLVRHHGINWVDVSSGGLVNTPLQPSGPGFHAILGAQMKRALADTDATVSVVGGISSPEQAETMLRTKQVDAVSIGRAAMRNPHWPAIAAARLGVPRENIPAAPQYWRAEW
ncbi:NADH:flavin oxidoreductase/NADH oxidase [Bifidobacterium sp. ESL0790]|uniref:NADH:flavin oxidoreductase/NADH oxidase n=1 Tax=Bifidobacterium sp. ESL0790 TaxID=2983233 RepID=UPI0023FA30F5|nr:NADH:flavin oxidoreductase/NADH oxidase [Bifidobacterium sp. ESL0790]WEV72776.1 NADH:flavin oxidoreductase/NADH oxidase [Bifidobacterium sp. ESL0790]